MRPAVRKALKREYDQLVKEVSALEETLVERREKTNELTCDLEQALNERDEIFAELREHNG